MNYTVIREYNPDIAYDEDNILKVVKLKICSMYPNLIPNKYFTFRNCSDIEVSSYIGSILRDMNILYKHTALKLIDSIHVELSDSYEDYLDSLLEFIDNVNDTTPFKFTGKLYLTKRKYVTKEFYNKVKNIKNTTE